MKRCKRENAPCEQLETNNGERLTGVDRVKFDTLHMRAHEQTAEWFVLKKHAANTTNNVKSKASLRSAL